MILELANSHLATLSEIIRCASTRSDRDLITQSVSAASWSELVSAFGMSVREDEIKALCFSEVNCFFDQVSAFCDELRLQLHFLSDHWWGCFCQNPRSCDD